MMPRTPRTRMASRMRRAASLTALPASNGKTADRANFDRLLAFDLDDHLAAALLIHRHQDRALPGTAHRRPAGRRLQEAGLVEHAIDLQHARRFAHACALRELDADGVILAL